MLDPRVYRTGLIVAALAFVMLAFSLQDQQPALTSSLAPDAFSGQNVATTMAAMDHNFPDRAPGSSSDEDLASVVWGKLKGYELSASKETFSGRTVAGTRTLENIIAVKPGVSNSSIVIVADRDLPGVAGLSATATLLELGRDLEGETLSHTVVLASTSGSQGAAGATQLAASLPGPVDAVIVLGDLANAHPRTPLIVPWAQRPRLAPPVLRNTLAFAVAGQTAINLGAPSLAGQFAHLALPLTLGEQAPFAALGAPAVTLSLSGDTAPTASEAVSAANVTALGRAALQTVSALDAKPGIPGPSGYLLFDRKVIPQWAISLFVLALIVPVALAAIDGLARARRRGRAIVAPLALILAAAVPFMLAVVVVFGGRAIGVISAAPPGPVARGAVPLDGGGSAVLVVAALAIIAGAAGVVLAARRRPPGAGRRTAGAGDPGDPGVTAAPGAGVPVSAAGPARGPHRPRVRPGEQPGDGAPAAMLAVLCIVTLAIWTANPFAAGLVAVAAHAWMWAVDGDLRIPVPLRLALVALGLVPLAWVVVYAAGELGLSPLGMVWAAALMVAGHGLGPIAALEWCIVLGCAVSVTTLAVLAARRPRVVPAPVTVRGPITYAGPGSLGGTKSALRR